jgi:hypothetical protein
MIMIMSRRDISRCAVAMNSLVLMLMLLLLMLLLLLRRHGLMMMMMMDRRRRHVEAAEDVGSEERGDGDTDHFLQPFDGARGPGAAEDERMLVL